MRRIVSLTLSAALLLAIGASPVAAKRTGPTIVDAAIAVNAASGEFDHLIAAAARAGLVDALDGQRQLTVFAPTDAAFEALFAALGVASVDDIPVDLLTRVLLYHVAPGDRSSTDVLGATRVRTLEGGFLSPSLDGGTPYVNDAQIVIPDIDVANGRIHVIDAVLLPAL